MIDIDRILNIHQSYSQQKIGALNKKILIAQYAQSEQIIKVQEELKIVNETTKSILNNQLRELQEKEIQKYYKNLIFNINLLIDYILKIENPLLKTFLFELFSPIINNNIDDATNNLIEISDKIYCKASLDLFEQIKTNLIQFKLNYQRSPFIYLLHYEEDYTKISNRYRAEDMFFKNRIIETKDKSSTIKNKEIQLKIKPLRNPIRRFFINLLYIALSFSLLLLILAIFTATISIVIVLFIVTLLPVILILFLLIRNDKKWKKNYSTYYQKQKELQEQTVKTNNEIKNKSKEEDKKECEEKIINGKENLETHIYLKTKTDISNICPNWIDIIEESSKIVEKIIPQTKVDNLCCDIARHYFLNHKTIKLSDITIRFNFSIIRAGNIIQQLEDFYIIDHTKRKVQFNDPIKLELALLKMNDNYSEIDEKYIKKLYQNKLLN